MAKGLGIFVVVCAVAVLLALGAWQVQRLQWKQELIAAYEAAQKAEPVALESLSRYTPYTRVTVTGEFLSAAKELHLGGRRYHTRTGYQILNPFRVAVAAEESNRPRGGAKRRGSGGASPPAYKYYLINRGWVPTEKKDPATRDAAPAGEVTLTGMIRLPEKPGMFSPENHPEKNFWFYVDVAAMERFTSLTLEPLTVELIDESATPESAIPIPFDGQVVLRNDHLGYALTWFSLAIAAAVIGWLRLRRAL